MKLELQGKIPNEVWRLLLVAILVCGGVKGSELYGLVLAG